jgi:hypothetical protein
VRTPSVLQRLWVIHSDDVNFAAHLEEATPRDCLAISEDVHKVAGSYADLFELVGSHAGRNIYLMCPDSQARSPGSCTAHPVRSSIWAPRPPARLPHQRIPRAARPVHRPAYWTVPLFQWAKKVTMAASPIRTTPSVRTKISGRRIRQKRIAANAQIIIQISSAALGCTVTTFQGFC